MSEPTKAVFLSYASQDAEAAKRICEALRQAGVEVWFDADGGLEHGDEWDAKIRRQIKECVLFLPIISANTQAREEGYFRLEWDLAAERARTIASGVAFILPVVVDDTREPDALVPDRFRTVQWTKLPGGHVPPEVLQRFLKLWSHRTGVLKHLSEAPFGNAQGRQGARNEEEGAQTREALTSSRGGRPRWLVPAIVSVVAVAVVAAWFALRPSSPPASPAAPAAVSESRQLVAKAWEQMNKPEMSRAELSIADNLCQQAAKLDASDADVWAAWSQVDTWLCYHNFENTPARRESARSKAAQALKINPASFEARLAHACYLVRSGGEASLSLRSAEADRLLQALLGERRDEPRALLALGILQRNLGHSAEARTTLGRLTQNPAFAALGWVELGFVNLVASNFSEAEKAADQSHALKPFWINQSLKLLLLMDWRGDLEAAKKAVDQMTAAEMQEDYAVYQMLRLYLWRREPQQVLAVAASVPRDWLSSNGFEGPLGWWTGQAEQMAGRAEAAKVRWRAALKLVEQRLNQTPSSAPLIYWRGMLLAALGEKAESEAVLKLAREMGALPWWTSPVQCEVLNGHRDAALDLLEQGVRSDPASFPVATLQLEPYFDPLREQPRFKALLAQQERDPRASPQAEPTTLIQAGRAPEAKSVAVLAFANLSDDKANEYFSDGISEELLNVLAKVPGLKVTARTSAFHFKGKDTPIAEIAKQLGVAYVVEGSVRKAGGQVRITAQLIKATDSFHVWSETFTRDLKDVFAVQDEIAGLIAKNLQLKLGTSAAPRTVNPEAYELQLKAQAILNRGVPAEYGRGIQLLKDSLAIDGDSAPAWAWLASGYMLAFAQNAPGLPLAREALVPAAREAADRSIQLDPQNAFGYYARALIAFLADWDWAVAEASLQRVLALAPGDAGPLSLAGSMALTLGQTERGLDLARRASALDPLNFNPAYQFMKALWHSGKYGEMQEAAERMIVVLPASSYGPLFLSYAQLLQGRPEAAVQAAGRISAPAYRLTALALALHGQGKVGEAATALEELKTKYGKTSAYQVAENYAFRNDLNRAFEWLEAAYRERDSGLTLITNDPFFKNLRGDARWSAFMRKMNLPDGETK